MFPTNLVLEERVPDVFRHPRHSQNVTLTFLVSLGCDTIVEHDAAIPNSPESTEGELTRRWVLVDRDHLLEQLHPSPVRATITEPIVIVL